MPSGIFNSFEAVALVKIQFSDIIDLYNCQHTFLPPLGIGLLKGYLIVIVLAIIFCIFDCHSMYF